MTTQDRKHPGSEAHGDGAATPPVVQRADFDRELDQQVAVEKELDPVR